MSAIALYARQLPGFDDRVAQSLAVLRDAAAAHAGRIVQATSLGAEDMVITDLIARHGLAVDIATLATGKLHAETDALVPRIEAHYGPQFGLKVARFEPKQEAVVHFVRTHGEQAMYSSIELRKGCCNVRKLEPLSRMLEGRTAWVTGLRREQSDVRAEVPFLQPGSDGRVKVNALADWSWADVWHYIALHRVPYNPLHDQFYPSIGCAPCTRAIAVGEPFRAGRWWWEDEAAKECGLHVEDDAQPVNASRVPVTA
jgi:phosphoadenosine phosphosulfate reductase